jgi:hypothetical protein
MAHGALSAQYQAVRKRLAVLAKGAQATWAQRKKAIVAVARQLAVDLWRVHTARCTPQSSDFGKGTDLGTWRVLVP